ncbi:endonuclease MutS2 [Paenibacillus montaniterrae]|uniref:Endonuclease MutS2 n=1 Tax=Paenibacillus montaniterrae TaxID=429341 RepID=A0A920CXL6_9BACL|nr:endonuclease MutS2 [Paenibacillus montaniterrae]GIP17046.1 endonuclease MutS2 [Paenibacillus montaniterrae]
MNSKILTTLEYSKIVDKLKEHAATSLGKSRAEALSPQTELEQVKALLRLTDEAYAADRLKGAAPFGGIFDISSALHRARIHATLNATELLEVASTSRGSRRVKRFIEQVNEEHAIPSLLQYAEQISEHRSLEEEIFSCIDDQGEVMDSASAELASLRRELRNGEARIREKLESMIRSSSVQKMLQEAIITLRNNRFVIPVKSEYRSSFGGIVHDQSGSGATLFIEPEAIVAMNNRLRELHVQEIKEIEKILQRLTALVSDCVEDMLYDQELIGHIDFTFAKARLAHGLKAILPMMNDRGYLKIKRGRHPLLDQKKVVPLDVELGNQYHSIIVTGPNTGGKTVSLKTVGLLSLMAMSGLFVPAEEGTQLCVFDAIYADIGDEQSIEQSLSTFSSHMTNIIRILEQMTSKSLVLLDELGAGTDPAEGSALAIAILEHIHAKECRVIATTHYSELKAYAFNRKGVINASMEFDIATLSPTYRLLVGIPGRSNAFAIAERLGLSPKIIEHAKGEVSDEDMKVESMIASLEQNRISAESDRELAQKLRLELEQQRMKYEHELQRFEEQKIKLLEKAQADAEAAVSKARKEAEEIIADLRKLAMDEAASIKEHKLIEAKRRLDEALPELAVKQKPSRSGKKQKISAGDEVKVYSLNSKGHVVELHGDEATVQLGIMKMKVKLDDLELLQSKSQQPAQPQKQAASVKRTKDDSVRMELDLRGESLEEAILEVDRFIDESYMAGMGQVYIIHGKGTGILRTGIQQYLRRHSLVKSYRDGEFGEGGNGVTVAQLK